MKREFRYGPLISNLFLISGVVVIIVVAVFDIFIFEIKDSLFFWGFIVVSIFLIVLGMYKKLSYYVYIGEYALSVNTSILKPNASIPWREVSDIEVDENKRIIIVYRSGDRVINLFIYKINIVKNQWDTVINNVLEQWKESPTGTDINF